MKVAPSCKKLTASETNLALLLGSANIVEYLLVLKYFFCMKVCKFVG